MPRRSRAAALLDDGNDGRGGVAQQVPQTTPSTTPSTTPDDAFHHAVDDAFHHAGNDSDDDDSGDDCDDDAAHHDESRDQARPAHARDVARSPGAAEDDVGGAQRALSSGAWTASSAKAVSTAVPRS